jgi:hypothetical protein
VQGFVGKARRIVTTLKTKLELGIWDQNGSYIGRLAGEHRVDPFDSR